MQILYKGTPPGDVVYVGTCSSCQTKVKFKKLEAKECGEQRDGFYLEVQCPVCPSKITSNYTKYIDPLLGSYLD